MERSIPPGDDLSKRETGRRLNCAARLLFLNEPDLLNEDDLCALGHVHEITGSDHIAYAGQEIILPDGWHFNVLLLDPGVLFSVAMSCINGDL